MKALVAGSVPLRAGKTTFSLGLVERLGAVGYKPRSAFNWWHHHDPYREAVGRGRLYGRDARKLAAASPGEREPESINAVHRLWRPLPVPERGLLGREGETFVLDRAGSEYVVNGTAEVPALARERLPLSDARRIDSVDALDALVGELHEPALATLASEIRDRDAAVVESYADVAVPVDASFDRVAVIEPTRVRIYDGERYLRAREVAGRSPRAGRLETPVEEVTGMLDPIGRAVLPPLSGADRGDPTRIAEAYEPAYDALLG